MKRVISFLSISIIMALTILARNEVRLQERDDWINMNHKIYAPFQGWWFVNDPSLAFWMFLYVWMGSLFLTAIIMLPIYCYLDKNK